MAIEIDEASREVTVSTNRQVGLASDFARRMGARPKTRLIETLVRLPGGAYGVLLMRRPKSYAGLLTGVLAPGGAQSGRFLRQLRDEWQTPKVPKAKPKRR